MQHRGKWMKRFAAVMSIILLVLFAVSTAAQNPTPPPVETPTLSPTETPLPTETLAPTATSVPPTETETPSPSPQPTNTLLSTDAPTSTYTSTAVPSETFFATPTLILSATTTLTPTFLPPTIVWMPVFSDAFTAPNLAAWNFTGAGWGYAPQPDGTSRLLVFNSSAPAFYQGIAAADVAVDVGDGNAHVYVRHSSAFAYETRLTTAGEVVLLRAGSILASAQIANFLPNQPHRLRLNSYGEQVWVEVDGLLQLSAIDSAPLPPGRAGFSASFPAAPSDRTPVAPQNTVAFDEVVVYQPFDQVTPTALASLTPVLLPSVTPWIAPTATPAFPPVSLVPETEVLGFRAFSFNEPIEVPAGDVNALVAAMSLGGTQTINLSPDQEYLLTSSSYDLFGATALPIVFDGFDITIDRRGATLRATALGFRIFAASFNGRLTLRNMIIRDATLFTNGGAAVSNQGGFVTLDNVRMENNRVESDTAYGAGTGGAVYTFFGRTTIIDSFFIDNYAVNYGGALYGWDSEITISGTRFEGNEAGRFGGAIGTRDERSGTTVSGQDNLYSGNSAVQGGGAFYVESGGFNENGSVIADNTSAQGGVLYNAPSGDRPFAAPATIQVTGSDITGGSTPLVVQQVDGSTLDFDRNWWGNADGPNPADLIGDGITVAQPRPVSVANCTDSDGDCLPDAFELTIPGLSPTTADSDGNGIEDGDEDSDEDGLTHLDEFFVGTTPTDDDSDDDGLTDGDEVLTYLTDPLEADTDGDGLNDGFEVTRTLTKPLVADSDNDGTTDAAADFDEDGLTNLGEQTAQSDPFDDDSDDDRLPDGFEVNASLTSPTLQDTNTNEITDDREDPDADALNHYQEFRLGTDPLTFTTLGAPSRLRSETVLMPVRATADGSAEIVIMTVVRDAQGRFLPARAVTWTSSNPNLVFTPTSGDTDEEGVATVQVTSAAVTSGVVEIRALDVVVGRPLV